MNCWRKLTLSKPVVAQRRAGDAGADQDEVVSKNTRKTRVDDEVVSRVRKAESFEIPLTDKDVRVGVLLEQEERLVESVCRTNVVTVAQPAL